MSETKPENPPLFELENYSDVPHGTSLFGTDITLRDLFAAAALAGACVETDAGSIIDRSNCAEWCYGMADAMLAERAKGEPQS